MTWWIYLIIYLIGLFITIMLVAEFCPKVEKGDMYPASILWPLGLIVASIALPVLGFYQLAIMSSNYIFGEKRWNNFLNYLKR